MQSKPKPSEFARTKLPWVTAGVMLLVYLVTVNQWVSTRSLPVVAKVEGWDWALPMQWPLFFTLTYPLRWLSPGMQPLALNLFSVICGTLTIALLVRSVGLLPHDRTDEQRIRQRSGDGLLNTNFAWAPAVLAAAALGFELTMWEHATEATNEALDLLIFAYLIRCVLEFRIDKNEQWLFKLAFVYGLGVTNNWALIGFFPLFLASLIWIRGKAFFSAKFIIKMMALGLTGMLMYLVLPLVWHFKSGGSSTFWETLRAMLGSQKSILLNIPSLRARALILSLTSILPVAIMGVKFPAGFGETSSAGASITNLMFRTIHLVFAGACIWMAFDQKVSPRSLGLGLPFLTFYYLSALAVGYYVGYLMVVHNDPPKKSYRQVSPISKLLNPLVQGLAWTAVIVVPLALIYKNFRVVRAENGKLLMDYAEAIKSQFPTKPAIILSDDQYQLWLLEAAYARDGGGPHVLVNPRGLVYPAYHRGLVRRYGKNRWPEGGATADPKSRIDSSLVALALGSLARSNTVYNAHWGFGNLLEVLQPEPKGMVVEMTPATTNTFYSFKLSAAQIQSNQAIWKNTEGLINRAEAVLPFKIEDGRFVAGQLSWALNHWGVNLQRAGQYADAAPVFERALSLSTNNLAAAENLDFNKSLGKKGRTPDDPKTVAELFGYRGWDTLLNENGPVDVPEYLYAEGNAFRVNMLVRQAADCFARSAELWPTNPSPRMGLAATLITAKWTDEALKVIGALHQDTNTTRMQKMELISMEAAIFFAKQDTNRAETALLEAVKKYPSEITFYNSLNEMYRASGQWKKAEEMVSQIVTQYPTNVSLRLQRVELALNAGDTNTAASDLKELEKLEPNNIDASLFRVFMALQDKDYKRGAAEVDKILQVNEKMPQALVYKGIIHMEQKEDQPAIEAFTKALKADPDNVVAMRNRAIANLHAGKLNDAKKDYETLLYSLPPSHAFYYGLGEIAYKKGQKEEAIRNFELYLKFAPKPDPKNPPELEEERKTVEGRLKELKGSK